jgi:hypothetical protein
MSAAVLGSVLCMDKSVALCATTDESAAPKSIRRVSVELVVVPEPALFLRAWDEPGRKETPPIPDVRSLTRGSEFGIGVVVSDCPPGRDAKCMMVATYSIRTVDGEELVSMPDVPVWRDAPPSRDRPELGKGLWRTTSEDSDPLGPYIYRAVVRDNVSGKTVTLERRVSLVE